ncbi:IS66 family transposase, partial [Pseudomonas aeruginosa]
QQEGVVAAVLPLHTEAEKLRAQVKRDALKIQALTLELAHLRRIRFGVKNEALSPEQCDLFRETADADCAAIEAEVEQQVPQLRTQRPRAGRQPLPEHLPRIEHRHEPETCSCGQCGGELVKIGEDISEQLDVTPAKFFVHRHIRPQYACRPCASITAAPVPPAVIDGGMAAPGLISWVLIGKYVDHLPLYRLEQIAARDGVTLARSTLAEWAGRYGAALQPLADRLSELLRRRPVLHADETPVQQLDPGRGKTKRAYLWAYRSNDLDEGSPIAVFDYQTGRSGAYARAFLADWSGHLVVDDYGGYKALFRAGITDVGCMAHARRKFFELHAANQSPVATEALRRIAELYAIEARGRDLDGSARQMLRGQEALPKLQALHDWLQLTRQGVANGGGLAKAMDYSLKRWPALSRYAHSASLPIDNNPVENVIRPIAVGKKNWLFTGSERAGRRAAAIQSLLATAKLNGIEPAAWLKDTLEKLPSWPNSRIDELLPLAPQPE